VSGVAVLNNTAVVIDNNVLYAFDVETGVLKLMNTSAYALEMIHHSATRRTVLYVKSKQTPPNSWISTDSNTFFFFFFF